MYRVSFEVNELIESYIILKFNRTTLGRIYNKGVGEGKDIIKFINTTIKKILCLSDSAHFL